MFDMLHETPKRFIEQSFKAGYTIKLDTTFKFYGTKFHHDVALAITCISFSLLSFRISHRGLDRGRLIPSRTRELSASLCS